MNCPTCSKPIDKNPVREWREKIVQIPNEKTQLIGVSTMPSVRHWEDGHWVTYSGPVVVVLEDVGRE